MTLPDICTFWLTEGEQCGRSPISGDYFEYDPLKGEKLVASLCSRHDGPAARRYALAHSYDRRDRKPAERPLTAMPGGITSTREVVHEA